MFYWIDANVYAMFAQWIIGRAFCHVRMHDRFKLIRIAVVIFKCKWTSLTQAHTVAQRAIKEKSHHRRFWAANARSSTAHIGRTHNFYYVCEIQECTTLARVSLFAFNGVGLCRFSQSQCDKHMHMQN